MFSQPVVPALQQAICPPDASALSEPAIRANSVAFAAPDPVEAACAQLSNANIDSPLLPATKVEPIVTVGLLYISRQAYPFL
jgi:hypothetical protein